ncbi:hypothetical protein A8L34_27755 [Bacillus sp. FJAT-27264]|nr:hypothetical protein A8L34_27755 [Bacillus sp. FJAT-27264]
MKQNENLHSARPSFFSVPGDSLAQWMELYLELAVYGAYADPEKIRRNLGRFVTYIQEKYGQDRLTTLTIRDVKSWRDDLYDKGEGYMPSSVNGHLDAVSGFFSWVYDKSPPLLPLGDPSKGVRRIAHMPLVARALSEQQVASLKNACDRLEWFYAKHDRKRSKGQVIEVRKNSRPKRDRAIVFTLLSTGLRREELRELNLNQLDPRDPDRLKVAKIARLRRVRGKGDTEREVFLSLDARQALAAYIETERIQDAEADALFLTARGIPARKPDGRLSLQAINQLVRRIGNFHDQCFPERTLSPLQPHSLRHTFAFQLVNEMIRIKGGVDESELERRLGHRSDQYIKIYAHGPEEVSQNYVEKL